MPLANATVVNVVNGLTLNGTVTMSRGAVLYFTGTQTLGGTGQIVFAGSGGYNFLSPQNGTLTIGPAVTIRGGNGSLGSSPLINQGTISALALNQSSGSWVLAGGTIRGGSISTAGGAALRTKSGTLDSVTLDADLTLENSDQVGVVNGLTVNRMLTLAGNPNPTGLFFEGPQTLGGTGQVVFGGAGSLNFLSPNSALTIGAGVTIRGAPGSIGNATQPLINQGTIGADVLGKNINVFGTPVTNEGTLKVDGAGTTITVGANPFANSGTVQELNGGKIIVNP